MNLYQHGRIPGLEHTINNATDLQGDVQVTTIYKYHLLFKSHLDKVLGGYSNELVSAASLGVNNLRELTFSAREPKGKDGLVQLVAFAIGQAEPMTVLLQAKDQTTKPC